MVSIVIPSRSAQYLKKTVQGLLNNAEGEVEVIVVYDGRWPEKDEMPSDDPSDPRIHQIHHGELANNYGMRASINLGMRIAQGEYVMKCDEHIMMAKGYDTALIKDCQDDWIIVPRRMRLDPENWRLTEEGKAPVDYMYIAYPYERPYDRRCGLYGGGIDKQRTTERKDIMVDETMSMQGSCWFTKKAYFDKLFPDGLDDENYGPFNHEAQEVHFKAQLSGGKLMVNKNTWYAHYHKGKNGKGYAFTNDQYRWHETNKEKARRYCMDYWLGNKWEGRTHDFVWLIDHFKPPTWPENWQEKIKEDAKYDWANDPSKQPSEWIKDEVKK